VNTIEEEVLLGRRNSVEFKAEVVAACQAPEVSLAAIALHHKLNANLCGQPEKVEAKIP
jgi:transposase-like protein